MTSTNKREERAVINTCGYSSTSPVAVLDAGAAFGVAAPQPFPALDLVECGLPEEGGWAAGRGTTGPTGCRPDSPSGVERQMLETVASTLLE